MKKQVCLIDGIQHKWPGQRVPGEPTPGRNSGNFRLCRWDNLLGQEPQIVIRAAGAGLGIFEGRRTVPGYYVVVPILDH